MSVLYHSVLVLCTSYVAAKISFNDNTWVQWTPSARVYRVEVSLLRNSPWRRFREKSVETVLEEYPFRNLLLKKRRNWDEKVRFVKEGDWGRPGCPGSSRSFAKKPREVIVLLRKVNLTYVSWEQTTVKNPYFVCEPSVGRIRRINLTTSFVYSELTIKVKPSNRID